jgi:hypothetical protein
MHDQALLINQKTLSDGLDIFNQMLLLDPSLGPSQNEDILVCKHNNQVLHNKE